jgi:class 3 adenylate cyclase
MHLTASARAELGGESSTSQSRRWVQAAWVLAGALPLIGLGSLLLRSQLDPHLENHKVHFVLFAAVGGVAAALAYVAGEAATKRGDARVLLISLAFLATGGFLWLHAIGTPGILFSSELAGFQVAIPVGLLVAAIFAFGSAFIDLSPEFAPAVMSRRALLRGAVFVAMGVWSVWTLAKLPPLNHAGSEGATDSLLAILAALGVVVYGLAAARYWVVYSEQVSLLPASVIACFVLLSEAMVGVAVTGERKWHASWWEWHGLIIAAYLIIGFAARREWRDERFRLLYLPETRHRTTNVSVLFTDLAGFTSFSERSTPSEVATLLGAYYEVAAPLISQRFGGEIEKFMGDGMMATFNSRGDQPDHALRAAGAGLALQREVGRLADQNPGWPRLRVGVNTGVAVLRELGGYGHIAYSLVGDTVNTASRLQGRAPVDGVLIGSETYRQLPDGAAVEALGGVIVKGKDSALEAYVLHGLPAEATG